MLFSPALLNSVLWQADGQSSSTPLHTRSLSEAGHPHQQAQCFFLLISALQPVVFWREYSISNAVEVSGCMSPCSPRLHHKLTYSRPSIVAYTLFAVAISIISQISNQNTPATFYLLAVFFNGLCIGAALNYTLAHLLHLTAPSTHFISTSLLATFRGFAGSFGSAIGGGLFVRTLKVHLETGFKEHGGLEGKEDLIKKLLGSPAMVKGLIGEEKEIALDGYVAALKAVFMAAAGLALSMVVIQAFTGWKEPAKVKEKEKERLDGLVVENSLLSGEEEEEREEGMEQGV